ncbi:hypothetical protein PV11_03316 [Exophiala sideris]|uniref:Zn(2)-C6 fungal-type domain-containing protein n=1 Tax=Exophiala sideris TaxID=1016849 RepID=A0A0D1Z1K4_9EURO|nr:hypothetical protein PV11_03316 [Exophiala sideris]
MQEPSPKRQRTALYQKKRATIACEVCRSRKSKCDGVTPQCGFCKAAGADCKYVVGSNRQEDDRTGSTQARLLALEEHVEKLNRTVSMLSAQNQLHPQSHLVESLPASGNDFHPAMNNVQNSGILKHMMANIDYDVTRYLTGLESSQACWSATVSLPQASELLNMRLLQTFFDKVHIWYPLFEQQTLREEYLRASQEVFSPSPRVSLYLMISAMGMLALDLEDGRSHGSCDQVTHAAQMLYTVIPDQSITSIQCLLLHAIYHLLCFRPIQAYEYVTSAAYKAHNLYKRDQSRDVVNSESFTRAFYSIYILERELLVQLNLASSGLRNLEENIPLPSGTFDNGQQEDGGMFIFFMAEIALQKMMEQSDRNFSSSSSQHHNGIHFPTLVAEELEFQILEWRSHLPPALAFPDIGFCRGDLSLYLKLQYHAHMCGIFWLALYKAVITSDQSPDLVTAAEKCLRSYCSFVETAADFFSKPVMLPHIAMTLTSIFTISLSMAFVKNAQVPLGLEQINNPFKTAVRILSRYGTLYPPVGEWSNVLQRRLDTRG